MAGKQEITLFGAALLVATTNGSDVDTKGARGIHLVLNITAVQGTSPTGDIKLQRKDPLSGIYVDLPGGAFAQKTATGADDLTIFPAIAETANRSVSDVVSEVIRAVFTLGGTDTPGFTFSLAGSLIP